jgi:hypothetical protein
MIFIVLIVKVDEKIDFEPKQYVKLPNLDLQSNFLGPLIPNTEMSVCEAKCIENNKCLSYTWSKVDGSCSLKMRHKYLVTSKVDSNKTSAFLVVGNDSIVLSNSLFQFVFNKSF